MNELERTGEKFDLAKFLAARDLCKAITKDIAGKIAVGLSEADGQALVKEEFKKHGITKFWHPTKVRIGPDTVKSFREPPDASIRVRAGDLFFLDVGPVIGDHEADYGQTFSIDEALVAPAGAPSLIDAAHRVWEEVAAEWRRSGSSGRTLYRFAGELAEREACILNPSMSGHRLGDFPHALFSKESLSSLDFRPTENLWVLEIHVLNQEKTRGAFYEDILAESRIFG